MKSRNMMLATAIVAAFGLAGCNSNRAPDNGGTDSHHTETRATGGNTKTTGRVCQLLQDDNPNRGGRKVVYRCNGRAVLASDEAKRLLNPSVPVSFGGSGSVVQSNLITRQAANATGKSDEVACERAFINAAHKFQATAQSRNANRVSNFHSYYNRKILHGGQYDCEVGTFHARVVMRGDIAR